MFEVLSAILGVAEIQQDLLIIGVSPDEFVSEYGGLSSYELIGAVC